MKKLLSYLARFFPGDKEIEEEHENASDSDIKRILRIIEEKTSNHLEDTSICNLVIKENPDAKTGVQKHLKSNYPEYSELLEEIKYYSHEAKETIQMYLLNNFPIQMEEKLTAKHPHIFIKSMPHLLGYDNFIPFLKRNRTTLSKEYELISQTIEEIDKRPDHMGTYSRAIVALYNANLNDIPQPFNDQFDKIMRTHFEIKKMYQNQ